MIDDVKINLDASVILALNLIIAFNMFIVSLSLRLQHFKQVAKTPKSVAVGLFSQFILLPFFSFLFTLFVPMHPSVALALIMVASCPGGNLSNVFTFLAKGNLALSVSLTAVGFPIAMIATPLNFGFYASMHPEVSKLVAAVGLDPVKFIAAIFFNMLIPLVLGCYVGSTFTRFYNAVAPYTARFALISILTIVLIAIKDNLGILEQFGNQYVGVAIAHNLVVLLVGYLTARLFFLPTQDKRSITIETGIQNCPLGTVLILTFMPTLGGAVITITFWGAWQILSTWMLSSYWKNR
ncbi:MAG: bile acid:sodium symporter family protein [Limnobacter sp.]|nr:bile acid:sodium symporter family protein [Limnobacter sp.]